MPGHGACGRDRSRLPPRAQPRKRSQVLAETRARADPVPSRGHGQQDKRSPGAQEANSIAGSGNHARTIRSIPPGHAARRTPVPARSSACGGAMHQLSRAAVRGWPWGTSSDGGNLGIGGCRAVGGLPGGPATQGDDAGHVAISPRGSRTALRPARRPGPRLRLGHRSRGCRRSGRPARSGPASARPLRLPPRRPACR